MPESKEAIIAPWYFSRIANYGTKIPAIFRGIFGTFRCILKFACVYSVGWDSSVGIETCYGLDGPGIKSRWGSRFSAAIQTGPGAHPTSYTMRTRPFPELKRSGRGADHSLPSSAGVKERVKPYIYSPSGPSWPLLGWTLLYIYVCIPQFLLENLTKFRGNLGYREKLLGDLEKFKINFPTWYKYSRNDEHLNYLATFHQILFFFFWHNGPSGPAPPFSRGFQSIQNDARQSVGLRCTSD